MNLASPALVVDVTDMNASRDFAQQHLGFQAPPQPQSSPRLRTLTTTCG